MVELPSCPGCAAKDDLCEYFIPKHLAPLPRKVVDLHDSNSKPYQSGMEYEDPGIKTSLVKTHLDNVLFLLKKNSMHKTLLIIPRLGIAIVRNKSFFLFIPCKYSNQRRHSADNFTKYYFALQFLSA